MATYKSPSFTNQIVIGTAVFWLLGVAAWIVSCFLTKDRALLRTTILLATACLWLMWIVTFMSQMYPIIIPNFSTRPNITHT